jgi:ParB-like nuclease domain
MSTESAYLMRQMNPLQTATTSSGSFFAPIISTMCRRLIAIDLVVPLHEPNAEDRFVHFFKAMQCEGWGTLPPLIVVEQCGGFYALTGAHRYAAAKKAGITEFPCLVISELQWETAGLRLGEIRQLSDQKRAERLCEIGLRYFAEEIELQNAQIANGSQPGFCGPVAAR